MKGEINNNTIIVGDFNTPLTPMGYSTKQKINKETQTLNDTIDKLDLIDIYRTFHAKMGSIKDRNGMDITEAEDIKKRCQEYTEELYKKDLHNPDNHDG